MAISVTSLHPVFGAEIRGVDLCSPISAAVFGERLPFFPQAPTADPLKANPNAAIEEVSLVTPYQARLHGWLVKACGADAFPLP